MQVLQPDNWKRPRGYSNGIAASGRFVFVAGQVAFDPTTAEIVSDDFAAQVRQTLANTVEVLREGGAEPGHICRMTWYVTSKQAYIDQIAEVGAAYQETIGRHYPAIALIEVKGLLDPRAQVEIETTAVVPE